MVLSYVLLCLRISGHLNPIMNERLRKKTISNKSSSALKSASFMRNIGT